MPISLAKATEILALNLFDRRRTMPPDVAESLQLAVEALALIIALRAGNGGCLFTPLPHEEGYKPPIWPEDHDHPGSDTQPIS